MTKAGVAKLSPVEDEQKYRTPCLDQEALEQGICNLHAFVPFPTVGESACGHPRLPSFEWQQFLQDDEAVTCKEPRPRKDSMRQNCPAHLECPQNLYFLKPLKLLLRLFIVTSWPYLNEHNRSETLQGWQ